MNRNHPAQIVAWLLAILLTARLTWTAYTHHLPTLETACIAIIALYTFSNALLPYAARYNARRNETR